MTAQVGVVILSWNHVPDTLRCLAALLASDYDDFQVVVVDNGSQDGAVASLREQHPGLTILENGQNLGYTGGNNVGIAYALDQGVSYVLLLNDDAVVERGTLSALMAAATANPQAGFLGPKIYALEEPRLLLSAGGQLRDGWMPSHRGMGELDNGQYGELAEVDYLSGCALLVNRKAIETVGVLDPGFFAYYEDVEWCTRGKQAGLQVLFVPEARVWHPDTRSRDSDSALVTYYTSRNLLLFASGQHLGLGATAHLLAGDLRTLVSWSLRPRWRHKRSQRDALARALLDFARGRCGKAEGFR